MRQVAVQAEPLREVPDVVGERGVLADRVVAEHADPPGVGAQQPAEQADRRRLAGAVRADQPEHLAAPDVERHVVDGDVRVRYFMTARSTTTAGVRHGYRLPSGTSASTGMPCFSTPWRLSTDTLIR